VAVVILAHLEHAASSQLWSRHTVGDGVGEHGIREIEIASFKTRLPEGVTAQLSAPQFSSTSRQVSVSVAETAGWNANSYAVGKAPFGHYQPGSSAG
jgi:hypothetical protein